MQDKLAAARIIADISNFVDDAAVAGSMVTKLVPIFLVSAVFWSSFILRFLCQMT